MLNWIPILKVQLAIFWELRATQSSLTAALPSKSSSVVYSSIQTSITQVVFYKSDQFSVCS